MLADNCYEAYNIQVQGLATRLAATDLKKLVIGVSGGLDSTQALIVCARAMDELKLPRAGILAYTMPGFATTSRTKNQAWQLMRAIGATAEEIDIRPSCMQMLKDIGHPYAKGRKVYDRLLLRVPLKIGDTVRKVAMARFSRTLSTLVAAGVDIIKALEITGSTAGNWVIEEALTTVRARVHEGVPIAEPLIENPVFPAMVSQKSSVRWVSRPILASRSDDGTSPRGRPPMHMRPAVGSTRPAIMARSVDLPEPLIPIKAMRSPGSTVRLSPARTGRRSTA